MTAPLDEGLRDRLEIRELVERWVVLRDAGDWERFRAVWHDDGRMMATWTQGTADEFIAMSKAGWEKGVRIHHVLGGQFADVVGDRAISQVKMEIHQRAEVEGVEVDVTCSGRFYDFLEKRDSRWGSSCASRSTSSTVGSWPASPRATATSPTSRHGSATT